MFAKIERLIKYKPLWCFLLMYMLFLSQMILDRLEMFCRVLQVILLMFECFVVNQDLENPALLIRITSQHFQTIGYIKIVTPRGDRYSFLQWCQILVIPNPSVTFQCLDTQMVRWRLQIPRFVFVV
jgi:hypothetical protein